MIDTDRSRPTPLPLGAREMAEVLAALVSSDAEVEAVVAELAPRTADALLEELARIADGRLPPEDASPALRWVLPELHREVSRWFRGARC